MVCWKKDCMILCILGTSKLEWAVLLTDLKEQLESTNENFTITFIVQPLVTANGQLYIQTETLDRTVGI